MNILIIEDEPLLAEKLEKLLGGEHYAVSIATDGPSGLRSIWGESYDLILLDIMLPGMSGLEVLAEVRAAGIVTPILMLTAKGDIDDKVAGLDLGADDYLAKPFSVAELLARVRALLRRGRAASPILECGPIRLDTMSREALRDGQPLPLTAKEFAILEFLLHNRGRAVSRFALAEHVWGDAFDPFSMSNFITVHISNLRKKLRRSEGEEIIKSIRGVGYLIEREGQ